MVEHHRELVHLSSESSSLIVVPPVVVECYSDTVRHLIVYEVDKAKMDRRRISHRSAIPSILVDVVRSQVVIQRLAFIAKAFYFMTIDLAKVSTRKPC